MNNLIEIKDLKCPSKELDCVLRDLFAKYTPTITPVDTVVELDFDQGTNILSVTVNGVTETIDITPLVV